MRKDYQPVFFVENVQWERVFLHLQISSCVPDQVVFFLERLEGMKQNETDRVDRARVVERVPLPWDSYEDGVYSFCCNITAMNGRTFLNNGIWRISAETNHNVYVVYASFSLAYHFDEYTRMFRYGNNQYAYTVLFTSATENEKYLWFLMHSFFMIRNDDWRKHHWLSESKTFKGKRKKLKEKITKSGVDKVYQFYNHVYPKRGHRVLMMSETRDKLWGNLKAIDDAIKRRGLDKQFEMDYSFRKAVGKKKVISEWVRVLKKIAKADYIFIDDYAPLFSYLNLSHKTKLIQVWHAGEGFKAVGYARFGKASSPRPTDNCHKKNDYVLTGSPKLNHVFEEVFGIEKSAFLPVGMPRLDGFLDQQRIEKFKETFYRQYPELKEKKVILFAPTYRGTDQKHAYYDYSWLDFQQIHEFCGSEYAFVLKMHPFVEEKAEIPPEYSSNIFDMSEYPDINSLYYITDLLITDYSSNFYEYALMRRPMLFYTPDREIYELSRGVHRSVKENAPGKVCDTFEEMMDALRSGDFEEEKAKQFVKDNFANFDGHAADRAIDRILLQINKGQGK